LAKIEVAGIRFRWDPRPYDFQYKDIELDIGDNVVVEIDFGTKIGRVIYINKKIEEKKLDSFSDKVVKKVDEDDLKQFEEAEKLSVKAMDIFKKKIAKYKLEMKPVAVEYSLDKSKITFFFTSETRVDFRSLLKDLIKTFKKKIKLQQIGPRDESRVFGGYGECGRPVCCRSFLTDLESITMDMAREQNMEGKGASKISGLWGRLMCCLAFEREEKTKKVSKKKSE